MSEPTGTEEQIRADRIAKLEAVRAAGGEPYPARFEGRVPIADVRARFDGLEAGSETGDSVRLAGRVMGRRGHGKAMFLDLVDAGARLQLHATLDATPDYERF
ncbi:MAG: lysyl-tRNA synthetase, class, partial [Gaiellales bacterium]|nr:lysyl-tRNA synthetase, class [Gaiellales bacterium]